MADFVLRLPNKKLPK